MATGWKPDAGWKQLETALDAKAFDKNITKALRKASILNGKLAEAQIRRTLATGAFKPNAALTIAIKGSSKPLVDNGQFFQFITSKVIRNTTVFVGVLRTDQNYNLAVALHDGVSIRVTPKMRGLFFILWQASTGAINPSKLTGRAAELFERLDHGWKPLAKSTKVIVIPPRPFVTQALMNAGFKETIKGNWRMALQAAMKEQAEAGK